MKQHHYISLKHLDIYQILQDILVITQWKETQEIYIICDALNGAEAVIAPTCL